MRTILCLLFLAFVNSLTAQTIFLKEDSLTCILPNENERQTGTYQSFHPNGQKRAEGKLENNLRAGTWTLWDSTGKKLIVREYQDPLNYKQVYPKLKPNATSTLWSQPAEQKRTADGYLFYVNVRERAVEWSNRIWSNAMDSNNTELFSGNALWQAMVNAYEEDTVKIFNDKWVPIQFHFDSVTMELRGFEFMEDAFFDTERLITESRMIAIKPIIYSKQTGKQIQTFKFYFPYLRKYLVKVPASVPSNKKIENLDDVFIYRSYNATITKESNLRDLPLSAYTKKEDLTYESLVVKCSVLEIEHDFWLLFGGYPAKDHSFRVSP